MGKDLLKSKEKKENARKYIFVRQELFAWLFPASR